MAINPLELRIGNLVQDEIGLEKSLVVYKLEKEVITCGDKDFEYPYLSESLKPIPLTSTILGQCGFIFNNELNGYELNGWIPFHIEKRTTLYDWYFITTFKKDWRIGKFQHLHQLQNLYYSLNGTELTIQL